VGECCNATISLIDNLFDEPLSGCLFLTVLLNLSPLVVLAYFLGSDSDQDCSDVSLFVIISIILFVLHIAFAVYMFFHLKEKRHAEHTNDTEFERTKEFLLENPVMACYIVVYVFAFVWAILGLVWSTQCAAKEGISSGSQDLGQAGEATAIVSLAFYGIGLCIFFANLCDVDDCCASMDCTEFYGCCLLCCCCCFYPCLKPLVDSERSLARTRREQRRAARLRAEHERKQRRRNNNGGAVAAGGDGGGIQQQNVVEPVQVTIASASQDNNTIGSADNRWGGGGGTQWHCSACTMVNPSHAAKCQACNTPRYGNNAIGNSSVSPAPKQPVVASAYPAPSAPLQQNEEKKQEEAGFMGFLNAGLKFIESKLQNSDGNSSNQRR